jgi:hypothetical protein
MDMQNFSRKSWTSACAAAKNMVYMPVLFRISGVVFCLAAALFCPVASAQLSSPLGSEYSLTGEVPGDQVFPRVALRSSGGYVVWHDNRTDGYGQGISARKLNNNFSPSLASFRVNQQGIGDQRYPDVTMLTNGGAAIVWQGNRTGRHDQVWLRILSTNGTFTTTNDLRVSTYTNGPQVTPVIATLNGGNLVVVWGSTFQDGNYQGVFGRILNPAGTAVTAPFQVNQFTIFNQRNPAVASLPDGGFVVTWVSENQGLTSVDLSRGTNRVHVYARLYDSAGTPRGDEFRVNTGRWLCAQPDVAASTDGGFTIVWSQRDNFTTNSWDIFARAFGPGGVAVAEPFRLNTYTFGEQYSPRISGLGNVQLVVWSSLGQEVSTDFPPSLLISGIYGRLIAEGAPNGGEFQVNTTVVSKQHQPAITADGVDRFLVTWASFTGASSFDILAQRFTSGQPLPRPDPPFVSALSSSRLLVSWPELLGFPVTGYEVYMDGAAPPAAPVALVTNNMWTQAGLVPASTHSFRLAYIVGGQRSSLSDPASATTWGEDENVDGLPDDWQERYWGSKPEDWPGRNVDSDGDGATNASEYLAGTDPTDPDSVLKTWISRSPQGRRLNWSTQPGFIYQVQTANGFGGGWVNFGSARFAAGSSDSILSSGNSNAAFYRIIRVR